MALLSITSDGEEGPRPPLWRICVLVTFAVWLSLYATLLGPLPGFLRDPYPVGLGIHPTLATAVQELMVTFLVSYFAMRFFFMLFQAWLTDEALPSTLRRRHKSRLAPLSMALDNGLSVLEQVWDSPLAWLTPRLPLPFRREAQRWGLLHGGRRVVRKTGEVRGVEQRFSSAC